MQKMKSNKRNVNNEMQNLHFIISDDVPKKAVLYSMSNPTKNREHYIY
mgnify:CR=1 FL=1